MVVTCQELLQPHFMAKVCSVPVLSDKRWHDLGGLLLQGFPATEGRKHGRVTGTCMKTIRL